MPVFTPTSKRRLLTCDPRLQRLFNEVVTEYDCSIICGFRNKEAQDAAFAAGFSKVEWPNGKHNCLPSNAVDVLPAPFDWKDEAAFRKFAAHVFGVWSCLGDDTCKLVWGGGWKNFPDSPHWEIHENAVKEANGRTGNDSDTLRRLAGIGVAQG